MKYSHMTSGTEAILKQIKDAEDAGLYECVTDSGHVYRRIDGSPEIGVVWVHVYSKPAEEK